MKMLLLLLFLPHMLLLLLPMLILMLFFAADVVVAANIHPLEFHNFVRCEISQTPAETPTLLLQPEREREITR